MRTVSEITLELLFEKFKQISMNYLYREENEIMPVINRVYFRTHYIKIKKK